MRFKEVDKLVTELKEVATRIQELKKVYRDPKLQPPHMDTYVGLRSLKRRATLLCCLRAHWRGRLHLKGLTLHAQEELVKPLLADFEREATAEDIALIARCRHLVKALEKGPVVPQDFDSALKTA